MVRQQQQPPTPRRRHKQQLELDQDELIPKVASRYGSNHKRSPSSSRSAHSSSRPLDPEGASLNSMSEYELSIHSRVSILERSRASRSQVSRSDSVHTMSSSDDWRSATSTGTSGIEVDSRDAQPQLPRLRSTSNKHRGSPKQQSRRSPIPEEERREQAPARTMHELVLGPDDPEEETSARTLHTEYDNVIVSRSQKKEPPKSSSNKPSLRLSNRKAKKMLEEESYASMASSIDDSSGVVSMEFDQMLPSPSALLMEKRTPKSAEAMILKYRVKKQAALSIPKEASKDEPDSDNSSVRRGDDPSTGNTPSHSQHSGERSRSQRYYAQNLSKGIEALAPDADESTTHGSESSRTGPKQLPPTPANRTGPSSNSSHSGGSQRLALEAPAADAKSRSAFSDDFSAAETSVTGSSAGLNVQPLRWTEQETDNLLLQLEFFGDHNGNLQTQRFPKRSVQKVVANIQAIVEKESLRRDDPILQNLTRTLHSIRMVDLDKLLKLLHENHKVGHMMEGKRVLMLCGPTGSGKTTTLHFFGGTTLEEVDEQGFFHLKPISFEDRHLKECETSCCRKNVTRTLQATRVRLKDKHAGDGSEEDIIVCDTPGLGIAESVEEEISNGLGMINELQRAKSVHPVLLLSRENLGSRFGNLNAIIQAMREQFVLESKVDLDALNYVFTKYEGKHRTRICKQIGVLEHSSPDIPEEDRVIYKAFVKDIIKKTTPKATLALPTEDSPKRCLHDLWEHAWNKDGKDLIIPFASKSANQKLKLQLQLTVYDFSNLLAKGDYPLALHRLHQLRDLAEILPEAVESADKVRRVAARHVTVVSDLIKDMVDEQDFASALFQLQELGKLEKDVPEVTHLHERVMKKMRKRLKAVVAEGSILSSLHKLEDLRKLAMHLPQAKTFVQQGFDAILKRLLKTVDEDDLDAGLYLLEELSRVSPKTPEAGECAYHGLKALRMSIGAYADSHDFDELLLMTQKLSKISSAFPEAKDCTQLGFDRLREKSIKLFEDKNYGRFISQIRNLSDLTSSLPASHPFANRGSAVLQETTLDIIKRKDFHAAVEMMVSVQNLQEVLPDTTECVRLGFESLLHKAVATVKPKHCDETVEKMMKLGQLLPGLPFAGDIVRRGLKPLPKNVARTVKQLDFADAALFLEDLHGLTTIYPEMRDAVDNGLEIMLQQSCSMIDQETLPRALDQLHRLGKLARKFSVASAALQRGFSELPDKILEVIDGVDFDSGVELLHQLAKLVDFHPDITRCISNGFEKLIQKAGKLMTVHDYTESLTQLEALGAIKHKFVLAEGCAQRGLTEFSITLNKFLQFMEFNQAIDVLNQLHKVARAFSEADQCVRLGYELLLEQAIDSFENGKYAQALREMKQLGQLYQQFSLSRECNRGNLTYLATLVPGSMQKTEVNDAIDILRELTAMLKLMPEALECVHVGFAAMLEKTTSLITAENYIKPVEMMKTLARVVEAVPDIAESRSRGLHGLLDTVSGVINVLDFETSRDLLKELNGMKQQYPEALVVVQFGFDQVTEKAAISFATGNYYHGINQMQQLGQLRQSLHLDDESGTERKGVDLLQLKVVESIKTLEFDLSAEVIERVNKMTSMFPPAREIVQSGYRELASRTAMTFEKIGHHEGGKQLQQLGQLRQMLALDESVAGDRRSMELLKSKVLQTMEGIKLEEAIELIGRLNKGVHTFPETEEIVQAGYKQLLSRTASAFENDGHHQGVSHLQDLGQLRQILEMDERSVNDTKGNHVLQMKVRGALKTLEFDTAVELLGMINELAHLFPEVNEIVEAGFGELLEKTATTFAESGYGQGINQLDQLGRLKLQLEVDDSALKESRRAVLLSLVRAVQRNVESLDFRTALKFVHDLNDVAKMYTEAKEGTIAGFESLLLRVVTSFEGGRCSEGADRLEQLAELRRVLAIDDRPLHGLENLVAAAQKSFDSSDLNEIIELMSRLGKLADDFPEAREFVNAGVQKMWQGYEAAIAENAYKAAIGMLHEIGSFSTVSTLAERYFAKGKKRMKKIADLTMETDDFMVGIELSKMLVKIDTTLAEADDSFQKAGDRLRDQMEQSIRNHNYEAAADAIHSLCVEISKGHPQAIEYARSGVRLTEKQLEDSVATRDPSHVFSVLLEYARLETVLPEASKCLQHATLLTRRMLEKSVERSDYPDAVVQLETLYEKSANIQNLIDVVQFGIILLGKAIEKPMHPDKHDMMTHLVRTLSKSSLPRAGECARRGLKGFWKTTKQSIEDQEYATAMSLIRDMRRLADDIPEAGDCVQLAFVALRVRLVKAIDKQRYATAILLLQQLSTLTEELPEAFECAQFGFEALQERLEKTIEEKNFRKVVQQMNDLAKVTEDLPEVNELFLVGLSALSDAISRLIERTDYADAASLMEILSDLAKERSEVMDCIRQGLFKFWGVFEEFITNQQYSSAVNILQKLGALGRELTEAADGVQLGFEVLEEKFEKMIEERDYDSAVSLMQNLSKLAYDLPEASSCIQNGFEVLRERLVKIIEQQDYSTARSLIGKLEQELPSPDRNDTTNKNTALKQKNSMGETKSASSRPRSRPRSADMSAGGSQKMGPDAGKETMERKASRDSESSSSSGPQPAKKTTGEYASKSRSQSHDLTDEENAKMERKRARSTDMSSDGIEKLYTEASSTGTGEEESTELTDDDNDNVPRLRAKLLSTIEKNRFGSWLDVMVTLSNMEHVVAGATVALELGYTTLKEKLKFLIAEMECSTVLDMMRTFNAQVHRLPIAKECIIFGLKELQKSVDKRVDQKEYMFGIDLLQLLCKLSVEIREAKGYTQSALDGIIQHMVMLREETATSFEELAEVKDMTLLAKLLETTCESLETVMATEELRNFCSQWERSHASETDPDALTCTVRLTTSETFCSEQLCRLAETILEEFPLLVVEAAHIEKFYKKQDELLSVIERLLLLRRVLHDCPGSEVLHAAFMESFEKLQSFLDGVVSLAQTEFMPHMNLKAFENHVVLLRSLVDRLLKSRASLQRDERKKVEDLEHRCTRLLLRFEIEVADALEVLENYIFPHFGREERTKMSSYIRTMRISTTQKHRDILLACVNSKELSDMISENVDVYSAERTLSSFDKALERFIDNLIFQLEEEKAALDATPQTEAADRQQIEALCKDVPKVLEEVKTISEWPTEVYSMDTAYYLNRLKVLQEMVDDFTRKNDANSRLGFSAFLSTFTSMNVSDYYGCMNGNLPGSM